MKKFTRRQVDKPYRNMPLGAPEPRRLNDVGQAVTKYPAPLLDRPEEEQVLVIQMK